MRIARGAWALLYDGDCRICTTFARAVKVIDLRGGIRIQPIQASRELLRSIPGDEILDAMHVVSPDGRVRTGGEALPAILAALTGAPVLEGLLDHSFVAAAFFRGLYAVLVELRGHLTCRYDATASEEHSPRPGTGGP